MLTLKPVQRQHPPLWIAASGDPAVERAAKHGDAWLINPHASLPTLERQMALYRRTLAAAGRTFPADAPILKEFRIAATRRQALEESKAYLEPKYRAYADWGLDKPMPKEESLADIERHARVLGVNHFIFRVQWPGMPQEDALMQIERLGRAVAQRTRPTH